MSKSPQVRPRVFVGSSREGLDTAYALQVNLEHDAEVTVWSQGIFEPSKTTIESLERQFSSIDFAIFVFSADDFLNIRGESLAAVRDNVIFELGLSMGKLGRDRSYIVQPRIPTSLRIPTDLLGITTLTFDAARSDNNTEAALGPACNQIRRMIKQLGHKRAPDVFSATKPAPSAMSAEPPAQGGPAEDEGQVVDEVTQLSAEIRRRALARLPPSLRPQKHSRWAGTHQGARYYHLWYLDTPWHNSHFRFQLWLEAGPKQHPTLSVGFSMKSAWLEQCGFPANIAAEVQRAIYEYAKHKELLISDSHGFFSVNYVLSATKLSDILSEQAATHLHSLIADLVPIISNILPHTTSSANGPQSIDKDKTKHSAVDGNIRSHLQELAVDNELDSKSMATILGVSQNWISGRACQNNLIGRPVLQYKKNSVGNPLTGKDGRYRYSLGRVLEFVDSLEYWVGHLETNSGTIPLWSASDHRIESGQYIPLSSVIGKPGMPNNHATVKKYLAPPVAFCISSAGQGYSLLYPAERLARLKEHDEPPSTSSP